MLNILLIAALSATALTVLMGIMKMLKNQPFDAQKSSCKMMQWRIFFHTLALGLLTLLLLQR